MRLQVDDIGFAMNGSGIRTVQELLGYKDVSTTLIYTNVLRLKRIRPVKRPLES